MIPTEQKTSISPYSFTEGIRDPHHHYTFYYGTGTSNHDFIKIGYWHITDTEIIYLARRSRLDKSHYKLIKYDILANSFGKKLINKAYVFIFTKILNLI